MDGGFRVSRPSERSGSQPVPARQQEPVAQTPPVERDSRPAPSRYQPKEDKPKKPVLQIVLITLITLVVLGTAGYFLFHKFNQNSGIDSSRYQGVFLTNDVMYYGKLSDANDGYMKLTDVYYLHTPETTASDDESEPTNPSDSVQLIKRGSEVHGPEDVMYIAKDQILHFENLKTDGVVAKSIEQSKSND